MIIHCMAPDWYESKDNKIWFVTMCGKRIAHDDRVTWLLPIEEFKKELTAKNQTRCEDCKKYL